MRITSRFAGKAAAAMAALWALPAAQAAGFDGLAATVTGYCCVAPAEPYRFTVPLTRIVGPGLEFPAGSIVTFGRSIIPSNIDIGGSTIDLVYTQTAVAATGSFNGFAFDFAGAGQHRITGVSLNPLSSFDASAIGLSFDADSVFYNAAGAHFSPGSRVLIDVSFGSVVPEPATLALAAIGLGGIGVAASRARRRTGGAHV